MSSGRQGTKTNCLEPPRREFFLGQGHLPQNLRYKSCPACCTLGKLLHARRFLENQPESSLGQRSSQLLPPDCGKPQSRSPGLLANTALAQPPVPGPSPPRPQGSHLPLHPPFLKHPKAHFTCLMGHSPNPTPWSTHQKRPFIFPDPREHINNYFFPGKYYLG